MFSAQNFIANRRGTSAVAALVVTISFAGIAWQTSLDLNLLQDSRTPRLTKPEITTSPEQSAHSVDLTGLFGNIKSQPIKRPSSLPQTRLQLSIRGLFANADGSGHALIAANNKPAKLYRVGEELPGNAVLESILAEHVVLKRAGRFEQLRLLPQQAGSAIAKTASSNTDNRRKERTASASTTQATSNNLTLTERLKRLRAQK